VLVLLHRGGSRDVLGHGAPAKGRGQVSHCNIDVITAYAQAAGTCGMQAEVGEGRGQRRPWSGLESKPFIGLLGVREAT